MFQGAAYAAQPYRKVPAEELFFPKPRKMNHSVLSNIRIGAYDLDSEQVAKINLAITQFITTNQPFLTPGYSLKDLARDTSIPLHHVSAFINQYYGIHFNEFLNRYRVRYFRDKIEKEEWKVKKLEAIAEESGFSNRNTFTIAFKKVYGQNPSEYMRVVRKIDTGKNCEPKWSGT